MLDLAAAAYSFQCKCAGAGPERGGEGSVKGVGAGKTGGEGQEASVVIAVMWLGGNEDPLGPGATVGEGCGRAGGGGGGGGEGGARTWRDRVCRYLLKSCLQRACGDGGEGRGEGGEGADGGGVGRRNGIRSLREIRRVRLGPPGVCPSPQASVSMLQHLSYHGCLHPALLSLLSLSSSQHPPDTSLQIKSAPFQSQQQGVGVGKGRSGGARAGVGDAGKGCCDLEFSKFVASLHTGERMWREGGDERDLKKATICFET